MESLGEILAKKTISGNTETSESKTCPDCGMSLTPTRQAMLNRVIWVYPTCDCERRRLEAERQADAEARHRETVTRLLNVSGLGRRFIGKTFANFRIRPGTEEAYALARDYADRFDHETAQGLLFLGNPGSGKTHLVSAIVHQLIEREISCQCWNVPHLLTTIRSTFNRRSEEQDNEAEIRDRISRTRLLVLDDVGTEKVTDWVQTTLYDIINQRYEAMRPVIFTTNCSIDEIEEKIGEKTVSRILEMADLKEIVSPDYRKLR